jgi:hypothetical protein
LEVEKENKCRECQWFDPALDVCEVYGAVNPDDTACESFILFE